MANLKFLSTSKIRASELISDTKTYIGRLYGRLGDMFTTASPFSQILEVISEISELLFFYIEDATVEQNILTAQHPESIYGLARLTGHDAFRGASAIGEIAIRLNTSSKNDIAGDALIIPANTVIKSNSNGIPYTLRTNSDLFRIEKSNANYVYIPVIQGVLESQTVTGTGLELQSFNIITKQTDNDNVTVSVNGEKWEKFDSIYDMKANSKGYLIKTGLSNGLDIYFGNESFGMIPPAGSTIKIEYFISRGSVGNLNHSKDLTFKFQTEGFDSMGNSHNLNDVLELKCTVAPIMGADPEDLAMTKLIAPLASKSFVLATPDHYEYFLSRYGMFSYLDAYNSTDDGYLDDDNVIYLFMLPDTKKKLTKNQDYFSLPVDEFFFSQDEKNAIYGVLEKSGQQMVTTEVQIVDPVVKKFRIDVKVRYFENYSKADLFNLIRSKISEYLMNITRRDRLPKSDLIAVLEAIEGIDSVNIRFVSQKEEEARANGYYTVETITVTPSTPTLETIGNGQQKYVFFKRTVNTNTVNIAPNDPLPESVIGLDSFGDIILSKNEVALFRGGWNDRDGSVVADGAKAGEQAALSVYFDEPGVPNTIYSRIQTQNRKNI
mgnify:CR=1 FL=1|jgi:hypothetical protein